MPYLGLVAIAVAALGLLAFGLTRTARANPPPPPAATSAPRPPEKEPPVAPHEDPQAMCYRRAAAPTTDAHICPVCHSRTEHRLGTLAGIRELEGELPVVPGWELSLDAREFCRQCTPAAPARPAAVLVAKRDGKEIRTRNVSKADLAALHAYATDKKLTRRVKQLLGL